MSVMDGVRIPIERSAALIKWKMVGEVLVPGVLAAGAVEKTDGCAQAAALLAGRDFVTPSDVRSLAVPVLAHRLLAAPRAGATAAEIVESVVRSEPVPD